MYEANPAKRRAAVGFAVGTKLAKIVLNTECRAAARRTPHPHCALLTAD